MLLSLVIATIMFLWLKAVNTCRIIMRLMDILLAIPAILLNIAIAASTIVHATLKVGGAILTCSTLSFIGLGVSSPTPEWGSMIAAGREFLRTYPGMTAYPGLAIMLTVYSLNLMGDGLRDALDPRLKQ